ncbi:unnamed protein product [Medioppia subpectinata]|uniref:Uncharacterized protein n=1 Tax=Medioppia subpectinata TaxID=1979941 RepID=A0A7R9KJV5_9ACAR|nr:unnamed protein product [Medioppia subpectinata]CAG2104862.1 unnamed protein product [Medioppia subpectinata]
MCQKASPKEPQLFNNIIIPYVMHDYRVYDDLAILNVKDATNISRGLLERGHGCALRIPLTADALPTLLPLKTAQTLTPTPTQTRVTALNDEIFAFITTLSTHSLTFNELTKVMQLDLIIA